jgi:peptidoglycan/LPS O-acetylase OafA/YrhL
VRTGSGRTAGQLSATPLAAERLRSLDGLRGLAALVVVIHHCLLVLPALAAQMGAPGRGGSPSWWLTYTPAHLLWAGGEAVLLFFVLSGLVLALPHLRPAGLSDWLAYYVKRSVRLYLPVFAAVALTGAVVALVPRKFDPAQSWWMNAHAVPAQVSALAHDAWLLDGTGWLNSALWSLKYEVLFSLLLPVFVLLARRVSAPLWTTVPIALAACGWAVSSGHEVLSYLSVFAVGVLLAQGLSTLDSWADRLHRSPFASLLWTVVGVIGSLALLGEWWMRLLIADATLWLPIGRPMGVAGAAVLVFCFLHCRPLRALGESRPMQWLGTVSFSLYLVHEPIVVSIAAMSAPTVVGVVAVLVVGIPASFAVAVAFHRVIERPSQRLAGRAGRMARRSRASTVRPVRTVRVPALGAAQSRPSVAGRVPEIALPARPWAGYAA